MIKNVVPSDKFLQDLDMATMYENPQILMAMFPMSLRKEVVRMEKAISRHVKRSKPQPKQ